MSTIQLLDLILIIVIFAILILGGLAVFVILRLRNKEAAEKKAKNDAAIKATTGGTAKKVPANAITRTGDAINSIYEFMEFDEIKDNMIVRKNQKQYVMVIDCKGVNYDLLSEVEKQAVEAGFIELLNTLRFPIQLYVQTRTLNLDSLLAEYNKRTEDLANQIVRLNAQAKQASEAGNRKAYERIAFEIRRKENILEYGESLEDYTQRINENKNILQQKTYIVISYYPAEQGDVSKYSKEEINDIAFNELYTRAQSIISALSSADVTGKVLTSEELAELLYVAYNRDGAESYSLRDAINADYSRLYSTAKDIMQAKKQRIEEQVSIAAAQIASKSLIEADSQMRAEKADRARRVKARAKEMVDEYRTEISKPLYERTRQKIDEADAQQALDDAEKAMNNNYNN